MNGKADFFFEGSGEKGDAYRKCLRNFLYRDAFGKVFFNTLYRLRGS